MLARTRGATRLGVEARLVEVEVEIAAQGVTTFRLVGLSRGAGAGMEQRVRAALRNAGLPVPARPVTANFAPSALAKEGPPLDLPLALALVACSGLLPREPLARTVAHGELALDGAVRPVAGALAAAEAAAAAGAERLLCAPAVAGEAAVVPALAVHPVARLDEAVAVLRGAGPAALGPAASSVHEAPCPTEPDLADVRGQAAARRAVELAAAGGHGLLLVGPPGAGKSLLARRLPGLLPPLAPQEALEVTRIHSAAGLLLAEPADHGRANRAGRGLVRRRPFRAPHHSVSAAGLLGGGAGIRPGEITLAHRGVLFLDELPEFRRDALEGLRQPLEDGALSVVRAGARATLPCRFLLAAAMNPCPCGHAGAPPDRGRDCRCTPPQVERYRGRVSGPLLDRLDLHVELPALRFAELQGRPCGEASGPVAERVAAARCRQLARDGVPSAELAPRALRRRVRLDDAARSLLEMAIDRLGLSARAHDRVLRVALTARDLARADSPPERDAVTLTATEVGEALAFRVLDRARPAGAP